MRIHYFLLLFCFFSAPFVSLNGTEGKVSREAEIKIFKTELVPVLKKYCYECHNADTQEGDVRLDQLNPNLITGKDGETWHEVLNKINIGEMPPKDAEELPKAQRELLTNWIAKEIKVATEVRRSTDGRVVIRRLNRAEYNNTMCDLLGIKQNYAADLPPESASRDGFKNNGSALGMSPLQLEYYLKTAQEGLRKAIVEGPEPEVFEHLAEKSTPGKRVPQLLGNRIRPESRFLLRMTEYPDEGEFLIRVKAGAIVPDGMGYPRLQVSLGFRADTEAPIKQVQEMIDVRASVDDPQVYEFTGRVEQFPLPNRDQGKYPGFVVTVRNMYDDGTGLPNKPPPKKPKKPKKGEKPPKVVPPPPLPEIQIFSVGFKAPVFAAWPPKHHTDILIPSENKDNESVYAREVIANFMERAFRRPVDQVEVDLMEGLYKKIRPKTDSFNEAIINTLSMVLVSPEFLYLLEPIDNPKAPKRALTDHEIASRLSYFLWSTMPDEELQEVAKQKKLRDPKVVRAQISRMLEDEQAWRFIDSFVTQWLDLSAVDRVAINPEYYPKFDLALKDMMKKETLHFFAEVLNKDLSALNFIESDFTMLNQRLADHYGLSGPKGADFERVELNGLDDRGGLLTHASTLMGTSTGEDSHPIFRGIWVLDRLLHDPPPPPPPNVPALDSEAPDLAGLSIKRQLEIHREEAACNSCHKNIDPWGIPLEGFDAIGLRREKVKRVVNRKKIEYTEVEKSEMLPSGDVVSGVKELKQYLLLKHKRKFAEAFVAKLLTYSLGRSLEFTDHETVTQLADRFEKNDYKIKTLIEEIVLSEAFCTK